MKTLNMCLIVGIALAMPVAAFAQSNTADVTYCTELSHQYEKYVTSSNDRHPAGTPADVGAAMSKCPSDAASAIPVLEKALTDHKINLPPRA